jgi:hypothetical protein
MTCTGYRAAGQGHMKGVSRPVGRVLCSRSRGAAVIHLGLPLPATSCGLPASIRRAAFNRSRREPLAPLLTLLRVGFTEPPQSPATLVVSYTTVSPLPPLARRRSVLCGTVPRVAPGRRYRPPCPVEPGPSSPGLRPARPPGRLTHAKDTPTAAPACCLPGETGPGAAGARACAGISSASINPAAPMALFIQPNDPWFPALRTPGALVVQVGRVVEGAEDGGAVGVPVDLA